MTSCWRLATVLLLVAPMPPTSQSAWAPTTDQEFTSTREVNEFRVQEDGTLWASTSGGALRFKNGAWDKFDSLPREVAAQSKPPCLWDGQKVTFSLTGLSIGEGKTARLVPLPPSRGTHISAVLARGPLLWVALFGDGIWSWNGVSWNRPDLHLPSQAQELTALAQSRDGKTVWLGTRRQGIWQLTSGTWKQQLQPDEPFAHNVQFLQQFRGALWASTLEDGIVIRDASGWKHLGKGVLSSNAPRQIVVFRGKLYVRHSNEIVDQFDGTTWKRNVFPILPRKRIISLAADEKRLYLGQWGGWSEWDGKTFVHHLRLPELQIVPLQHIVSDGDGLWLGTENRGLFRWKRTARRLEHFDERNGLPDQWISSIGRSGDTVYAGTFNSGLAWRSDGEKSWDTSPELQRRGVTAIVADEAGRMWIGTRYGLFCRDEKGIMCACRANLTPQEQEIQSLLWTPHGLWIGSRNVLLFRTRTSLESTLESAH